MLIKNWQGEKSWGQILKHLFSLKSHWIKYECYFIEDFNTRSFTWTRTLAFWLLIILWLACISWIKLNTILSPKLCSRNLNSNILLSLWDQNSSSHQRKFCTRMEAKYQSLDSQYKFQRRNGFFPNNKNLQIFLCLNIRQIFYITELSPCLI